MNNTDNICVYNLLAYHVLYKEAICTIVKIQWAMGGAFAQKISTAKSRYLFLKKALS